MITVVRLGSPRSPNEGLRLGTVRRPPRGVPKADFAKRDFYDVWLPNLAPSEELLKQAQQAAQSPDDARSWKAFERKIPLGDEPPRRLAPARPARGALPPNQLLHGLLLRRRESLPPLHPP